MTRSGGCGGRNTVGHVTALANRAVERASVACLEM